MYHKKYDRTLRRPAVRDELFSCPRCGALHYAGEKCVRCAMQLVFQELHIRF